MFFFFSCEKKSARENLFFFGFWISTRSESVFHAHFFLFFSRIRFFTGTIFYFFTGRIILFTGRIFIFFHGLVFIFTGTSFDEYLY